MSSAVKNATPLRKALVVDRRASDNVRVRSWRREEPFPIDARPAAHDAVEVAWIERGAAAYRIGSRTFEAHAGDVIVVPAQVEHGTAFLTGVDAGAVWLSRDFVEQVLDACGVQPSRLEPGAITIANGAQRLHVIGRELESEVAEAPGDGQLLAVESLAEVLVARLARVVRSGLAEGEAPPSSDRRMDRRIRAALELIESGFAEPLDVDAMAKASGMSRFHFSRAFREATGKAPYAYLLDVRIMRAAELLRGGHHSVTQAALSVGFRDLGRFARVFRAKMGVAPSEYGRQVR